MPRRKRKQKKQEDNRPKKIAKYRKPISINPGVLVFLVIFVYIVIMVVSYFRQTHIVPYEVKLGSLAINNTYDGVILRDEKVITSDFSGYINYYARESEKVSAFAMVYTVDSTGKLSEMINGDDAEGSSLSNESLSDIKTSISNFAVDFHPEKYIDTYTFKNNIEGTVLKLANTAVLANIDKLRAENYADSIDFGYAPQSGVIQYSTDGYEELTAETISPEQVSGDGYEKNVLHSNDLISEGDAAYKLITSELWSIMIEIDEERAQSLADKDYIEVRFLKNNYTAWGAVSVLRQNGKTYAKLDFNNSMITFASDRFVEIELLDNAREGLKIPNSAIVERAFYLIPEDYMTNGGNSMDPGFNRESYLEDGTLSTEFVPATIYNKVDGYVYVDESVFKIGDYVIKPEDGERYPISKQASLIGVYNINKGYADFKQITILNQNEEYAIVKSNSEYGLAVYDYIALKGDSITENDFIYD